jgi:multiple sugar transport system permease protein
LTGPARCPTVRGHPTSYETLQLFSEPLVLRPLTVAINDTYTPNLNAYTQAFVNNSYNLAAAEAVLLALVACLLSFGFLRLVGRQGDE